MCRRIIALLLIVQLAGMQWAVLQGVAWTRMLVDYSRKGGLWQGASETFDGEHPCPMCKMIKTAKAQTSRADAQLSAPSAESIWLAHLSTSVGVDLPAPRRLALRSPHVRCRSRHRDRPPLPPPR